MGNSWVSYREVINALKDNEKRIFNNFNFFIVFYGKYKYSFVDIFLCTAVSVYTYGIMVF